MSRIDDLYARYLTPLTRKLIGFGRSEEDAQDIAQETFIATWKRLDHVDPAREWWYLLTAGYNRARRQATRAHDSAPLDDQMRDASPSAEEALLAREAASRFEERFKAVMRTFPPETQQAIVLRSRGLGSKEIAQKLGLTDQAVRTRLSRAFETMRKKNLFGDPDDDKS